MRRLTEQEIKFLKETGWTPTMFQMDNDREYGRTNFVKPDKYLTWNDYFEELASDLYQIDLLDLYNKCTEEYDCISLENEAPYIMSVLLDLEQLDNFSIDGDGALKWLQDWQYFCGYRKADAQDARQYANIARQIQRGALIVREYSDTNKSLWIYDLEGNLI